MKIEFTKEEARAITEAAFTAAALVPDGYRITKIGEPNYLHGTVTVEAERIVADSAEVKLPLIEQETPDGEPAAA
jgi:hypothetical protein